MRKVTKARSFVDIDKFYDNSSFLEGMFKLRIIGNLLVILLFVGVSYGKYDVRYSQAKVCFKEGFRLYNRCKFPEAIVKYKEAIDLFPEFAKAWYFLGRAYYKLGQVENANSCFREFSALSEKDKELQNIYLGDKQEKEDKKARSITTYRRIACFKKGSASTSIAIDSHRDIFLVDFGKERVLKLSPTGTSLLKIRGKGEAGLKKPYGVWVDREGNIYVTDFAGDSVQKFDKTGRPLLSFGKKGRKKGEFLGPEGITCDREGNIYVVDNGNNRIQKFTSSGDFLMEFSEGLTQPVGIILNEGYIWVTDKEGLKRFDNSGNLLGRFSPRKGSSLRGLTFKDHIFYISDADGYVHEFNPISNTWQTLKLAEGSSPMDIKVDKHGTFYIADFNRKAIDIYMSKPSMEVSSHSSDFDLIIDRIIIDRFPTICLVATVATKDKRPLLGLNVGNFRIIEDRLEIPRIGLATPYQDKEDSLFIFVIDKKKVMQRYKQEIKDLLRSFTENFQIGHDAGAVISVSDKVRVEQTPSLNRLQVQNAISKSLNNFKERTEDEVVFSALEQAVTIGLNLMVKKAILFITSDYKREVSPLLKECVNYAKNNYIPIYVIDYKEGGKTPILQNLASETWGLYFSFYLTKHLGGLYRKIKDHMKTQNLYLIFYESETSKWSGEWVDIRICVGYFGLYGEDRYGYFVP
ncbi:MAG: tetratricopeptide repeat protein [bacterium]|nr:tetratricopeptide repeat protein [bacterium]